MPKATIPPLPLEGIFALAKPSGPTSMSIVTRLKPLFSSSRLFVSEDKLQSLSSKAASSMKESYPGPTKKGELTGKDRNKGKKRHEKTNWKRLSKQYIKIGSGGTLDPLADGVLIIGVGSGTKDLPQFLNCNKTYRTTGLLGCETDSYDSEGAIARLAPWRHVTKELLLKNLEQFRGKIQQIPPIYSALKIDGKPLYEYARQGKPLPRPIESRAVTISRLDLAAFTPSNTLSRLGHSFHFPEKRLTQVEKDERNKVLELVNSDPSSATVVEVEREVVSSGDVQDVDTSANLNVDSNLVITTPTSSKETDNSSADPTARTSTDVNEVTAANAETEVPPIFELEMTVSSGTYVRSVVHDLGIAVGSAAHVVLLTRTRQGRFVLGHSDGSGYSNHSNVTSHDSSASASAGTDTASTTVVTDGDPCVDWRILESALNKWESGEDIEVDEDGWAEWELEILRKWPKQVKLDPGHTT